jgi:hypothetical protein
MDFGGVVAIPSLMSLRPYSRSPHMTYALVGLDSFPIPSLSLSEGIKNWTGLPYVYLTETCGLDFEEITAIKRGKNQVQLK